MRIPSIEYTNNGGMRIAAIEWTPKSVSVYCTTQMPGATKAVQIVPGAYESGRKMRTLHRSTLIVLKTV